MTIFNRLKFLHARRIYLNEFIVLVYRFALVMFLFSLGRVLFFLFNRSLFPHVQWESFGEMMRGGLLFDTSALLYLNALYIVIYLLPFWFKESVTFQKFLKYMFLVCNGIGLAFNHIDFIYYRFILKRTTAGVFDIISNDAGNFRLILQFFYDYWFIALIWLATMYLLSILYSLFQPKPTFRVKSWRYAVLSIVALLVAATLSVIGMRGGYRWSTRPISMNNAGAFVKSPEEMAIVLNTPFCIMRTLGKKAFVEKKFFTDENELAKVYNPVRIPSDTIGAMNKKNVVVIILESFSREFVGSLNKSLKGGTYQGFTPFLDSLISQSLVYPNAFANGRKSIDAIPSVTASIPALVEPYVISERSANKINSLASLLKTQGYKTSFFHGAPNGSMGFDAFTRIAGYDNYVGRTEYANDDDFDGIWGVWDEPFFQFFANRMNQMNPPFMTTIFSVSSHHPFKVPAKYQNVFSEGDIPLQKCIRYTDMALQKFFATASKMPWFKNTVFVLTADHCSESAFREYKTPVNFYAIPLIFFAGDGSLKGVDNRLAQQIDIMPTLLGLLKFPSPYVAFGNDLMNPSSQKFVINYIEDSYQFLSDEWVFHMTDNRMTAIFNRVADPFLTNNLVGKIQMTDREQLMKAVIQQFNNRMATDRLVYSK